MEHASTQGFARILACVAEGTTSDNAVRVAHALAERFGAELDLLHAVPPIVTAGVRLIRRDAAAQDPGRGPQDMISPPSMLIVWPVM